MTATMEQPITETRTMAALAEILRAEGVHVVQVIEEWQGPFKLPRITFRVHSDEQALAVGDMAVKHKYPLNRLVHDWLYVDGEPIEPDWVMEFCRSGTAPVSLL